MAPFAEAREFRELTNLEGKQIKAEILELNNGNLKVRANGRVFEISLVTLSQADQDWAAAWDAEIKGHSEQLYYSELVFEDDFSGEGFKEQWRHYKSESEIKDGVLVGLTVDINDHPGVDSIRIDGRQDMEIALRFKFAGPKAERFNVWFDDKDYKGSHAGHICSIRVSPTSVSISDAKTGTMENTIYEARKSGGHLDDATKELLQTKTARFPLELNQGDWHELLIRTKADSAVVTINGKEIGSLQSEGVAHATKSVVSLTTNEDDVHYDNFVVKAAPGTSDYK
jgi:hypothetical protein